MSETNRPDEGKVAVEKSLGSRNWDPDGTPNGDPRRGFSRGEGLDDEATHRRSFKLKTKGKGLPRIIGF